ncbi:ribonuclease H-like domain-containing protein [Tanacetum coccineum]|uniref:Ribonuclease H-like domain-containing protein n=1 Tax=Tanacetum coccineum TaxID=301880 RepID=A0ABQ5BQZ4_9ASTR
MECTTKGTHDGKKKRDSFYQHQEVGKQEKNQMGLLIMDDGIVNWGEHTEDEETNHALMAISSSSEVSLCSKTCIDSYNTLKTLCDEQMNQLGDQEAQILAYSQAVKKLRSYNLRIGMKVVKEKEQLQKTLDSWKDSSKNLWRLINSGMSSSKEDSVGKPLYSRFIKTNDFKGVPHPLSGDYTHKPQEEIDESLTSSEHPVDLESKISRVPQEVYVSKPITTNEKGVSDPKSKEAIDSMDCNYYEKKMAREAAPKKQRVFNTGNRVTKPVWNNADRINHANHFVSRSVILNSGRPNVNSLRPNVNTVWTNINSVRQNVNSIWSNVNTGSFNVNSVRPKQPVPTKDHPVKNMVDRGLFDSGCSGHMTGNKDQLEDFEEFNRGSVTFGGSKGYITGKGRIRVGNLDFDSVSLVKELGHFNLFSISKICDKQHKVLFIKTECLVVSSDFKMPDENQILLKVPRHHNMYSFDMKTPTPAKGFACLIAKATSDESKMWHRRYSWVFFLASKDETSGILQNFIRQIENQLNHRVKIIRSDNGTEFKNRDMLEFCGNNGIKQEYSNAKTPQQNRVAERKNRTLIEAARTMLANSLLPTTFWAEAVSTACYVLNRVRVITSKAKTPYELLFGQKLIISYIRPFGCHVTILDTLSVLGKFDGKSDEGFLVGYSLNSKAYRVYNLVTKRVEVNLHVNFLEDKPNVKGVGYRWMFDIDYLTDSMNYIPVSLENQANPHAGTSEVTNSAGTSQTPNANASEEKDEDAELIVVPSAVKNTAEKVETRKSSTNSKKEEILTEPQQEKEASSTGTSEDNPKILAFRRELEEIAQKHLGTVPENNSTSTLSVNSGSEPVNTGELDPDDSPMPELEIFHKSETGIFDEASYDEEGVVTDFNSLPTEIEVSPTPTLRIHNIHLKSQILGDPKSAVQTRSKVQQKSGAHALISYIQKQQRNNHRSKHFLGGLPVQKEEP